jgi:hypothetical protein
MIVQYYFNNYASETQKNTFNSGNNKLFIFGGLIAISSVCIYFYTSNISTIVNINESGSSILKSVTDKESLQQFEKEFISSIKDQEVDVGITPF